MTNITEKLHKLEHALLDGKDDHAAQKAAAEKQRDREAEEKLKFLQSHNPSGDQQLSSVPPSQDTAIDNTNMHHVKPQVSLHHRAEDTALRPESQEHMNGVGTAGDDLAI